LYSVLLEERSAHCFGSDSDRARHELGEHTAEVLTSLLAIPPDALARLERDGVIATRRQGAATVTAQ
jgi:hypothetical protein